MPFVLTNRGMVNLGHVHRTSFHRSSGGDGWSMLFGADGVELGETRRESFEIQDMTDPIVPAEPGAFAYEVVFKDDNKTLSSIDKRSIVAWRIPYKGEPSPIFTDGYDTSNMILPLPDGRAYIPYTSWHANLEDAVRSLVKEAVQDAEGNA